MNLLQTRSKDKWTKLDVIKTATIVAKKVFVEERIKDAFVNCEIEPFTPQDTIEKIQHTKNVQKNSSTKN